MKLIDMLVEDGLNGWQWPEGAAKAISYSCIPGVHFFDGDGCGVDYSDLNTRELSYEEVTREQYEAALAAKNDGWIEWGGGECPVKKGTLVDVKHRDGEIYQNKPAMGENNSRWSHFGLRGDIIAYRLHKPTKSEQVRSAAWNAYSGITKADDETDLNDCASQDAAPVWNGEGLPPVGCDVEYDCYPDGWVIINIVARIKDATFIEWKSGTTYKGGDIIRGDFPFERVRPLRTEADKKRDAAVMAINNTVDASGTLGSEIYDAIAAGKIPGVKLED